MRKELTLEELAADPNKYGMPTFEQFAKNPSQWRKSAEEVFEHIDKGSTTMKNQIVEHKYWVQGLKGKYHCATLEEAQRILTEEGFDSMKAIFEVDLEDIGQNKARAHVILKPDPKQHSEKIINEAITDLNNKA